ncbi:MAG: NHL repeat-containing protein [Candidatus Eisenbacteria sp.]|nr:NHL repeat-containing protein [Candidatus Eisenbacteria bacterium]
MDRAHENHRRLRRVLFVALSALLATACGQQIELPPQPELEFRTPLPGKFNFKAEWTLPAPSDLAVEGIYLYVIEEESRIATYLTTRKTAPTSADMATAFEGLIRPTQLTTVARGDSVYVIVLDPGDMRCKIYYRWGGPLLHSFSDTLWEGLSGVAADERLHIYVADSTSDEIRSYDRWGHPLRVVAEEGSGIGYVTDPRGLTYAGAFLWVSDSGKDWVQRILPDTTSLPYPAHPEPIGWEEGLLSTPRDVAIDPFAEYVYITDTGHDRVLRFQANGAFADTVYWPARSHPDPPLTAPSHLAVGDEGDLVFVSQPDSNRIVLFELSSQ